MTSPSTGPIVGVVGCGVTGGRALAHLLANQVQVAVYDPRARVGVHRQGVVPVNTADDLSVCDVVVLCQPAPHAGLAERLVARGTPVVSIGDDLDDLRALLALQPVAERHEAALVVGAGMAPGLSGLLARSLAAQLATLDELHVSVHGTAGPACARQHHNALGDMPWVGTTTRGSNHQAGAGAIWCGFLNRSGRTTATGQRWGIRCCCIERFLVPGESQRGCPLLDATG